MVLLRIKYLLSLCLVGLSCLVVGAPNVFASNQVEISARVPGCGDGLVDTIYGEQCDGADLAGQTCEGLGYSAGALSCSSSCLYAVASCSNATGSNGAGSSTGGGGGSSGGGGGDSKQACPVTITPTVITDVLSGAIATIEPPFGKSVLFGNVEYKNRSVIAIFPLTSTTYTVDIVSTGSKFNSCAVKVIVSASESVDPLVAGCTPFTQKLKIGAVGPEVRRVQVFLKAQGYRVDKLGVFGVRTAAAVKRFQQKYFREIVVSSGLNNATGLWYPSTMAKANQIIGCVATKQPIKKRAKKRTSITPVPVIGRVPVKTKYCLAKRIEVGTINSDEVRQIQRFLIDQGYSNVRETGNYVADTIVAVKDFQTKYADEILTPQGFTRATGVWAVGTATKASNLGLCEYAQ